MEFDDYFTIEEIRQHCRVYHEEDDQELIMFTEAALEQVSSEIGRPILKKGVEEDSTTAADPLWPVAFNKRIRSAVLLFTSDLYENRGTGLDYQTYENRAYRLLLDPLRNLQVRFQ